MEKLGEDFFTKPTLMLAELLLGKVFVHNTGDGRCYRGKIVETEAYLAEGDEACHAYRGMTKRNRPMYGSPGTLYVYFSYGCHHLMNIVTEPAGVAGAVLIRAMEPIEGLEDMKKNRGLEQSVDLMNGPGKLTRAMEITLSHNGASLAGDTVFIEKRDDTAPHKICSSKRIGITKSTGLLWRRYVADSFFVSGKKAGKAS
ncbi:MAG: DNA-3-methyladenine glycosylase [Chlorobium sp.]|nr:DNA-3-methyladenine glycosylase [Chlorobium sp.]MCW8815524.1 DNA-3-methyladenine glycosylase [Chlorobium sp.]MCW8820422.1 DNA-3-methyladenine glycosylase [Ignavibacteriaceae bacterium]